MSGFEIAWRIYVITAVLIGFFSVLAILEGRAPARLFLRYLVFSAAWCVTVPWALVGPGGRWRRRE